MHDAIVIGSGLGGITAAHHLRQRGLDTVVLEAADAVGGTWRDNTYPGCACDVPSHLYSLSFFPKSDWTHVYSRQGQLRQYCEDAVDALGLRPHIRLSTPVVRAHWDGHWTVTTPTGDLQARFVVFAIGALRDPLIPSLPGTFDGPAFHSARWPADLDLTGKRVAVVGTGASAIQVAPALAPTVAHLTVFQRTAPWITRRRDRAYTASEQWAFAKVPGLRTAYRRYLAAWQELHFPLAFGPNRREGIARRMLERHARAQGYTGPMPPYSPGCKRVLLSDDWYPTLQRDNVRLVAHGVDALEPDAIVANGQRHGVDAIVWCTGFQVDQPLGQLQVTRSDGPDLRTTWNGRPSAHLGLSVPGFPNAFMVLGPNTALGHSSVLLMMEAQVEHAMHAIAHAGDGAIEPTAKAHSDWVTEMDTRHEHTVWQSGGCTSWYQTGGVNFALWPGTVREYQRRLRRFRPDQWHVR